MSNYRKTMGQAIEEMYPINEDNMDLMRKAAGGAMQKIKMKDGKLQMDSFTASAIMKVYDKVNPANQKKMADMINKGTKDGMMKLQDFAMKQVKSENDPEIEEEVDLDEGKLGDQWQKGAKSVKSGSFELIRGKSGVHDIMKSGKKIGTFSYDDEGDNFVANMKGERGQLVGNDIDTLISNFKEEADLDEGLGVAEDIPAMEIGTDRYREYAVGLTPGENAEFAAAQDFKVASMKEALAKVWGLDEKKLDKASKEAYDEEDEQLKPVKGSKTMTGGKIAKVDTKPKID